MTILWSPSVNSTSEFHALLTLPAKNSYRFGTKIIIYSIGSKKLLVVSASNIVVTRSDKKYNKFYRKINKTRVVRIGTAINRKYWDYCINAQQNNVFLTCARNEALSVVLLMTTTVLLPNYEVLYNPLSHIFLTLSVLTYFVQNIKTSYT